MRRQSCHVLQKLEPLNKLQYPVRDKDGGAKYTFEAALLALMSDFFLSCSVFKSGIKSGSAESAPPTSAAGLVPSAGTPVSVALDRTCSCRLENVRYRKAT